MNSTSLEKTKRLIHKPYFLTKNYLPPKKAGFSYLRYRILRPLLKLNYKIYLQFKGTAPWTAPASIELFEQWLSKEMHGLEWGSGSSTVFFSKRLKSLVSVEHNKDWYQKVAARVEKERRSNVDLKHVEINYPDAQLDKDGYQKAFTPAQVKAYEEYYTLIDTYPDAYFDFILIDGRVRVKCGEHAIPKLKAGGMLVLDNSERPRYDPLKEKLQHWPSIWTTTGLTDTTIWFKP